MWGGFDSITSKAFNSGWKRENILLHSGVSLLTSILAAETRYQLSAGPGLGPVPAEKRIRQNSGMRIQAVTLPSEIIRSVQKVKEENKAGTRENFRPVN